MQFKSERARRPLGLVVVLALWAGPLPAAEMSADFYVSQIMATLSAADQAWIFDRARAEMAKNSSDARALRDAVNARFESMIASRLESARAKKIKEINDYYVQTTEALVLVVLTQVAHSGNTYSRSLADAIRKNSETKAALRAILAAVNDSSGSAAQSLFDSERCLAAVDTSLQAKSQEAQVQAAAAAAAAAESYARVAKAIEQIIAILKG